MPCNIFQSTRPVRGATSPFGAGLIISANFNPRAPCGARLPFFVRLLCIVGISIHAPRAGRDPDSQHSPTYKIDFNPRAPCGARQVKGQATLKQSVFQSTRPVRGATWLENDLLLVTKFQSTRPVRGATQRGLRPPPMSEISIHAPRAGRDQHGQA